MEHFPPQQPPPFGPPPDSTERNWAMAVHLLTLVVLLSGGWLLNFVVPLVGLLWKRDESTFIADHSREQLNFQISLLLYSFVAIMIVFLTIGLGLLVIVPIGLVAAVIVLVVMVKAALAASRGERYRFPLTIRFVS